MMTTMSERTKNVLIYLAWLVGCWVAIGPLIWLIGVVC